MDPTDDQCDDSRADAVEDRADEREVAEVHEERAKRRHNDEVGQDKCPPAGSGAPEASAQIRNEDSNLDGQWSWERLTHRDTFAEFLFADPPALLDEPLLHLAGERGRAAGP